MKQIKIPAVFMRGGTSKAIVFHQKDLPAREQWDAIFLQAIGSPDSYGRQLDGMGGGSSSLSKICVVGPASVADADVDFTFAQVMVKTKEVDYSGNCGNMISAIGPFAIDEELAKVSGQQALVRIHNTNTRKIIHSSFSLDGKFAAVDGELEIPGVAGTGAPVRLDFLYPGGASTGKLLPTGNTRDILEVPGLGRIEVSMVDAANACVFVRARDLGLSGTEMPEAIDANHEIMQKLDAIRVGASLAMGISSNTADARKKKSNPAVGFICEPRDAQTLSGNPVHGNDVDLTARMIAKGQAHRALPLTRTLCMAVAARIEGTLAHEMARKVTDPDQEIRIGMPSGIIVAGAHVRKIDRQWVAERGAFLRTQRRLFEGHVLIRASAIAK